MKIAVTYNNGQIFQHFGHTETFKVYQVEDGKVGFNGPLNTLVEAKSSNYYLEAWFGEQTLTGRINTIAIVLMVVMLGGLL